MTHHWWSVSRLFRLRYITEKALSLLGVPVMSRLRAIRTEECVLGTVVPEGMHHVVSRQVSFVPDNFGGHRVAAKKMSEYWLACAGFPQMVMLRGSFLGVMPGARGRPLKDRWLVRRQRRAW